MNTELKSIKLRTRKNLQETAEQREKPVPVPSKRGMALLRADRLIRDLAVVGALFLTVLAVRGASAPQAQSVFSALKASANMQWDESLGQLSFVGGWLPESVQADRRCMPGRKRSRMWNGRPTWRTCAAPRTVR